MICMAGKKVSVWYKGSHIIKHECVDQNVPTMPIPGCYQVIATYDALGNIEDINVYADGITIYFGHSSMPYAFGPNVKSSDPHSPDVIDLSL